jgi:hypothetical protein
VSAEAEHIGGTLTGQRWPQLSAHLSGHRLMGYGGDLFKVSGPA